MEPTETAGAETGERSAAMSASTMCEAFQLTAAEREGQPALRLKDTEYEASFAEYAEKTSGIRTIPVLEQARVTAG